MLKDGWEKISRRQVFASKFLTVFEDAVRLPNGKTINDYTLVKKPDIVVIVATTPDDKLLTFSEYKYAANGIFNTLPAGHLDDGEVDIDAAKRELMEETGYTSKNVASAGILYEYPTKDLHTVHVVYARDIYLQGTKSLEETELIGNLRFLTRKEVIKEINEGEWRIGSVLGALLLSGFLLLEENK